jgi:hypothetical protein
MNKILVGLIVGAVLGVIDGATAWFTPAVRDQMLGIIIGSTFKGVIAGIAAGWYARRVHSVPKGIAFGFIVGLVLAFAVAAMPDPSGNHYWWQIMLPGSILGGVIGWATQRYGRPASSSSGAVATAMMIGLLLCGVNVYAHDHHATAQPLPTAAFEKLKGLAGTWNANVTGPGGDKATVEYRVTGAGSVVMETMFAGTDHEMINMYTLDGETLVATHYCSGDNQPVFRLNTGKSTADDMAFDFVSVTCRNKASYINGVHMRFDEKGRLSQEWMSTEEGHQVKVFLDAKR